MDTYSITHPSSSNLAPRIARSFAHEYPKNVPVPHTEHDPGRVARLDLLLSSASPEDATLILEKMLGSEQKDVLTHLTAEEIEKMREQLDFRMILLCLKRHPSLVGGHKQHLARIVSNTERDKTFTEGSVLLRRIIERSFRKQRLEKLHKYPSAKIEALHKNLNTLLHNLDATVRLSSALLRSSVTHELQRDCLTFVSTLKESSSLKKKESVLETLVAVYEGIESLFEEKLVPALNLYAREFIHNTESAVRRGEITRYVRGSHIPTKEWLEIEHTEHTLKTISQRTRNLSRRLKNAHVPIPYIASDIDEQLHSIHTHQLIDVLVHQTGQKRRVKNKKRSMSPSKLEQLLMKGGKFRLPPIPKFTEALAYARQYGEPVLALGLLAVGVYGMSEVLAHPTTSSPDGGQPSLHENDHDLGFFNFDVVGKRSQLSTSLVPPSETKRSHFAISQQRSLEQKQNKREVAQERAGSPDLNEALEILHQFNASQLPIIFTDSLLVLRTELTIAINKLSRDANFNATTIRSFMDPIENLLSECKFLMQDDDNIVLQLLKQFNSPVIKAHPEYLRLFSPDVNRMAIGCAWLSCLPHFSKNNSLQSKTPAK